MSGSVETVHRWQKSEPPFVRPSVEVARAQRQSASDRAVAGMFAYAGPVGQIVVTLHCNEDPERPLLKVLKVPVAFAHAQRALVVGPAGVLLYASPPVLQTVLCVHVSAASASPLE